MHLSQTYYMYQSIQISIYRIVSRSLIELVTYFGQICHSKYIGKFLLTILQVPKLCLMVSLRKNHYLFQCGTIFLVSYTTIYTYKLLSQIPFHNISMGIWYLYAVNIQQDICLGAFSYLYKCKNSVRISTLFSTN